MANCNFFYGIWHDYGGIGEGIDIYAPQNKNKLGFGETSKQQREQIFFEIVKAIHSRGEGLGDIHYQTPSSRGEQKLLIRNEIVHLNAVAGIITFFYLPFLCLSLLWGASNIYLYLKRKQVPKLKQQIFGMAIIIASGAVTILLSGPQYVFDWLHRVSFSDGHQWFFYYQDSLMSTLMLAPNLFAYIAVVWGILIGILFIVLQLGMAKFLYLVFKK